MRVNVKTTRHKYNRPLGVLSESFATTLSRIQFSVSPAHKTEKCIYRENFVLSLWLSLCFFVLLLVTVKVRRKIRSHTKQRISSKCIIHSLTAISLAFVFAPLYVPYHIKHFLQTNCLFRRDYECFLSFDLKRLCCQSRLALNQETVQLLNCQMKPSKGVNTQVKLSLNTI